MKAVLFWVGHYVFFLFIYLNIKFIPFINLFIHY